MKNSFSVIDALTHSLLRYTCPNILEDLVFKKNMNMHKKAYLYLALWGIFIACCAYMMPYFSNDYRYMLVQGTDVPVQSLKDIVISQWNHYFEWGGRTVAHVIAQLLLYFGKPSSAILNGLCYVLALLAIIALSSGRSLIKTLRTLEFMPVFIASMFLWLCLRIYGEVVLMPVSSSNYLYTTTLVFLFLMPYGKALVQETSHKSLFFALGMFLLGVVAGWTNENTGAATCASVGVALIYFLKSRNLKLWHISGALGLGIGYLLLILSPGNTARLHSMEDGGFTFWGHFPSAVQIYFATLLTQLPLLLACSLCVFKLVKSGILKNLEAKRRWYVAWWIMFTGFLSLTLMLASPNFPNRSSAPFTFFTVSFLCALYFISKKYKISLLPKRVGVVFGILAVLYLIPTLANTASGYYTAMLDGKHRDLEIAAQISEGKKDLVVKPFHVKTSKYLFIGDVRAQKAYFANGIVHKFYKVSSIRRSCNYEFPWYPYDFIIFASSDKPVCTGDRGDPEDPADALNREFLKDHPDQISRLKFKVDGGYTQEQFVEDMQKLGLNNAQNYFEKNGK